MKKYLYSKYQHIASDAIAYGVYIISDTPWQVLTRSGYDVVEVQMIKELIPGYDKISEVCEIDPRYCPHKGPLYILHRTPSLFHMETTYIVYNTLTDFVMEFETDEEALLYYELLLEN